MEVNTSDDPYEQKLYSMFKSFDVHSMEGLDKESLIKLCTSLELKDRGPKLVTNLINDKKQNRVTFKEFKEGLLNLLGTEVDDDSNDRQSNSKTSRKFSSMIEDDEVDDINKNGANSESKSREVSPKLVVGSKKYGRRSRPQSAAFDSSQSDSDEHDTSLSKRDKFKSKTTQKVQRSASQSDMHGTTNNRRLRPLPVTGTAGTKLKRCASLPAQKQRNVVITQNENHNLKTQLESSVESLGNLDFENLSNSLYEEWIHFGQTNENGMMECIDEGKQQLNPHHNQSELEEIFVRVGLQEKIASKVADEVFEKLGKQSEQRITFDDFMSLIHGDSDVITATAINQQLNIESNFKTAINIINDSATLTKINSMHTQSDEPGDWPLETMPVDLIIDMWEMAHVKNATELLDNLGFNTKEINLSKLSSVIDEELQGVHTDKEFTPLLRASLAIHKSEVNALQKSLRHSAYENKQLHANVRDLNRRAFMLAQEVDERHATLEKSARNELLQLEQRHTDIVRELTAQLASDRENWSQLNTKLEKRIKQLENDDAKHKVDVSRLQDENSALEKEQASLQTQITELLEMNIKLNNEIIEIEDRQRNENCKENQETDELLEVMDKLTKLQIENANLRDKNDELVSEIEELHIEIGKFKSRKQLRYDCSNSSGCEDNASNSGNELNGSSATKRRGDSPSKTKLLEESPRLGKLRKCHNENSEGESETSGDWLALNSELNQSTTTTPQTNGTTSGFSQDFSSLNDHKDEEIKELKIKIQELEKELKQQIEVNQNKTVVVSTSEKNTAQLRVKELECSLEQMQKEYEACEDYWQGKLNEERQLYEEEQRISDEKFAELLKKMAEYEEQFSSSTEKDGRLTPIEEKCHLEQQYADLETEVEEFRENARQILDEKSQEIERLHMRIKVLEDKVEKNTEQSSEMSRTLQTKSSDIESVASSPISYLWHQGTIQAPTRDYQNPNWNKTNKTEMNSIEKIVSEESPRSTISPIQRPQTPSSSAVANTALEISNTADNTNDLLDETSSVRSFGTHSVASTHSIHRSLPEVLSSSPNFLREDIKRLKLIELQLKDEVKRLAHQRDGLVMELQQLQEAKPVLEKAYARTPHPSLIQKIQNLEQKNRQLQMCLKQQQQYTESIMHQTWQQQRTEINELRTTLETQALIMNEQAQRLANSDLLVKDLYVENSQLTAAIQRLEQQRSRSNMLLQHQNVGSVPGML